MQRLAEGRIDMGVMYTPQSRPGLVVEKLLDECLVLVSSDPQALPEPSAGYVYVDWGPEFQSQHDHSFPHFRGPEIIVGIGWLGLQHILAQGGSGYFPLRLARPHVAAGHLSVIQAAPQFSLPAYTVRSADGDPAILDSALHIMRGLAQRAAN